MNDLARQLLEMRDQISSQWAGLLTRAAQALAKEADPADPERRCRSCGGDVVQSGRGRRRKYCSDRCRREFQRR